MLASGRPDLSYRIEYSPDAVAHLNALTKRQQTTVIDAVERQLGRQPLVETRNRKPMRPNPLAPWELRMGNLRVFYDVKNKPVRVVQILAVGIKVGNRVKIGKEGKEL